MARCLSCTLTISAWGKNISGDTTVLKKLTPYSAQAITVPHRRIWTWYTGHSWLGCYIWYSEEETGRGCSPPRHLLTVPNVTAHPSTASVPITILLNNVMLLCSFNVAIKGSITNRRSEWCAEAGRQPGFWELACMASRADVETQQMCLPQNCESAVTRIQTPFIDTL